MHSRSNQNVAVVTAIQQWRRSRSDLYGALVRSQAKAHQYVRCHVLEVNETSTEAEVSDATASLCVWAWQRGDTLVVTCNGHNEFRRVRTLEPFCASKPSSEFERRTNSKTSLVLSGYQIAVCRTTLRETSASSSAVTSGSERNLLPLQYCVAERTDDAYTWQLICSSGGNLIELHTRRNRDGRSERL